MRRSLGAAGLVVVFETWRDYVKTKRQRERRDLEKKYELEVKTFATAMQSVNIAQVRLLACMETPRPPYIQARQPYLSDPSQVRLVGLP